MSVVRWDYHATHVNQLLLLATIDKDPLLTTTANRWVGYMVGKRAPHNWIHNYPLLLFMGGKNHKSEDVDSGWTKGSQMNQRQIDWCTI